MKGRKGKKKDGHDNHGDAYHHANRKLDNEGSGIRFAVNQRARTSLANTASGAAVESIQLALMEMTKWPPTFRK